MNNSEDYIIHKKFLHIKKILDHISIKTPKLYEIDEGILIQEDLGEKTLLQLVKNRDEKWCIERYREITHDIIKLHSYSFKSKEAIDVKESFDYAKLMEEFELTEKYFFNQYLNIGFEDLRLKTVKKSLREICLHLSSCKKVLVHRDLHSRNVMVRNDECYLIDFQDARWGLPQYDLCSLFEDCYISLNQSMKYELLSSYWRDAGYIKEIYEDERMFYLDYSYSAIQRLLKALGSFALIYYKKNNPLYLRYISQAYNHLEKILSSEQQFLDLKTMLLDIYYEA